jgi:hypothetical protein
LVGGEDHGLGAGKVFENRGPRVTFFFTKVEQVIRYENIVRHIKSKRLSWLGHVERMSDERVPKTIYKWKPYATRPK